MEGDRLPGDYICSLPLIVSNLCGTVHPTILPAPEDVPFILHTGSSTVLFLNGGPLGWCINKECSKLTSCGIRTHDVTRLCTNMNKPGDTQEWKL